jgi:DNA repair protein RecO (recombination protein O)
MIVILYSLILTVLSEPLKIAIFRSFLIVIGMKILVYICLLPSCMVSFPMTRNYSYSALVLSVRPSGESNRDAWFLTAEEGILKATLFGGPKSRLRAYISPFHQGRLWVYHNPIRDSRKVTDFDVQAWRPGIREAYERAMTAGAIAETILASQGGGGNWTAALELASNALNALDGADKGFCMRIFIHFLWNWMDILGVRQDIDHCASCACEVAGDGILLFSKGAGTLHCTACAGASLSAQDYRNVLPISPGLRHWLHRVEAVDTSMLARYTLDPKALGQARALVTSLAAGALGKWLKTWDSV